MTIIEVVMVTGAVITVLLRDIITEEVKEEREGDMEDMTTTGEDIITVEGGIMEGVTEHPLVMWNTTTDKVEHGADHRLIISC